VTPHPRQTFAPCVRRVATMYSDFTFGIVFGGLAVATPAFFLGLVAKYFLKKFEDRIERWTWQKGNKKRWRQAQEEWSKRGKGGRNKYGDEVEV